MFDGAFHDRLTWVGDAAVAVRPVGAPGLDPVEVEVGVADDSDEDALVPIELIAYTR